VDDGTVEELPEHVRRNREVWDTGLSAGFAARARKQWAADPHWGIADFDCVDIDWARRWPSEEVWKARRLDVGY
jgi:hypothetical protein